MIDFALRYQAVIFSQTDDIQPKPDTLTYFINAFKKMELIPTSFQEIDSNGVQNRFGLKSTDNVWNIEFGSNRIDIHKTNSNVGITEMDSLDVFIEELNEIVNSIFSKYPRNANRVSLVTRYLLKKMNEDKMNDIYFKLFNTIKTHQQHVPVDWNQRNVSRISKEINNTTELFNVITETNRMKGNLKVNSTDEEFDGIELKFDLNTFQGNTDYRFSKDLIIDLYSKLKDWEIELKNEYLELLKA